MLPNFLVIGAQKSATKWLHLNLRAHPEFFIPSAGGGWEVHYWDSEKCPNQEWYEGHYIGSEDYPYRGDITPDYAPMSLDRIQAVYDLLPDARIIYVLRNPKDRAISAARMEMRGLTYSGGKRRPHPLKTNSSLATLIEYCCRGDGYKFGDYPTHIERWASVYDEDQISLLGYDDLRTDPHSFLEQVYTCLGASTVIHPDRVRRNVHLSTYYQMPDLLFPKLDQDFGPVIQRLKGMVPFNVDGWLKPISR